MKTSSFKPLRPLFRINQTFDSFHFSNIVTGKLTDANAWQSQLLTKRAVINRVEKLASIVMTAD